MNDEPKHTLPPAYFDLIYAATPDPWDFETSDYEAAKYTATLAALPCPRYRNAFEIGCSVGVLTERLAARCAQLLSVDVSEAALEQARRRCAHLPHVRFQNLQVPREYPTAEFDLTVFSEVGYYLAPPDLRACRDLIISHLRTGGHLLLVHWTPFVPDYPLTGDEVHDTFLELAAPLDHDRDALAPRDPSYTSDRPLQHLTHARAEQYRLDLFERR